MKYIFGDFELDTGRAELRRGGRDVALEPKSYALLCYLVGNHDRLVTRDEIVEKIWDGRAVSDSVMSTAIKIVRQALGDDGKTQEFIKTIRARGFRFAAPVKLMAAAKAVTTSDAPNATAPEKLDSPPKPSIAILPFKLVGFSKDFSAIADAVPSELISSLSRLRWLTLVARASSFRLRGQQTELSSVHDLLRAAYVGHCRNIRQEHKGTS